LRNYDLPVLRGLCAGTILAFVLVVAGCGERTEPVGPAEELFPLTITTADRPLTIPSPPRRIVVLKDGPESILEALDAPVVAANVAVSDLEGLRPDLVVAPSTTSETTLSEAAAAGAPVYVAPDTSITEVERAITQLGLVVAEPAAARRLVRGIEERRRQVARALRGTPRTRVFVDLGRYTTAPDGSLLGDLIREARGRNVAANASGGLRLGVEQLFTFDPEVYVSAGGATLAELRKGVRTKRLKAVRTDRVVVVDKELLSPGPDLGRGLVALARALHPDAFR
jgi:ABC-type Fe3+-hydroxamate transport system substrate-binding protein